MRNFIIKIYYFEELEDVMKAKAWNTKKFCGGE